LVEREEGGGIEADEKTNEGTLEQRLQCEQLAKSDADESCPGEVSSDGFSGLAAMGMVGCDCIIEHSKHVSHSAQSSAINGGTEVAQLDIETLPIRDNGGGGGYERVSVNGTLFTFLDATDVLELLTVAVTALERFA
jgi:hypothetical protein